MVWSQIYLFLVQLSQYNTIQYYTIQYNTIQYYTILYYLGSVPGSGNCRLTFGSFSNKPPSATPLRKALTCKRQGTKNQQQIFWSHDLIALNLTMLNFVHKVRQYMQYWLKAAHVNIYTAVLPYVALMFCQFNACKSLHLPRLSIEASMSLYTNMVIVLCNIKGDDITWKRKSSIPYCDVCLFCAPTSLGIVQSPCIDLQWPFQYCRQLPRLRSCTNVLKCRTLLWRLQPPWHHCCGQHRP